MKTIKSESVDRLFETFLNLRSVEECYDYFEDLCTVKELQDMAQRLDIAILLSDGLSYSKTQQLTQASTATIGRVNRCLNYGSGGYKSAIVKLEQKGDLKE